MYFKTTYDQQFDDLYMYLKAKYPDKLFDLDGIGKQLDMSDFSKNFFSSDVNADASIDANANVDDISVIAYNSELPKPFFRLNSYYVLWNELRKDHGLEVANDIVEKNLTGDIYINDFHGVGGGLPYSYYGKTVLVVKVNDELIYTTFEDLYNLLAKEHEEKVILDSTQIYLKDVKILDKDNKWVNVSRILKHKSHTDLVKIETKNGMCTIVTKDHPVILDVDMNESLAGTLTLSDTVLCSNSDLIFTEEKMVSIPTAYKCGKQQESIVPCDILTWDKRSIKAFLGGVIDRRGHVNKNGEVIITSYSFDFIQKVAEIVRWLGYGLVKTSFQGRATFNSKNEVYQCNIILLDSSFGLFSELIQSYKDLVCNASLDICYDYTSEISKIELMDTEEYVYDITTDSGHFHCQGLIQHNCFNYSTYDIHMKGLPMVKKVKSLPPKHLYAFKSQLEQFTVIASNSTLGATGLADMLVVMSYYVDKILKTNSDAHFKFVSQEDVWTYVKENIVSFIYTINQPMRANQSPFTNVSVYDDYFLESMCDDYIFVDGSSPNIETVRKLQEIYLDIMNEELKRTPLTFPVTTACFSVDEEKNIKDEKFLEFISKRNKKFGFINIYCGESSTLSSCCRLRSDRKNEYFNSFGSGSSKIGSLGVVTINLPRLAIKFPKEDVFLQELEKLVIIAGQINNSKREIIKKRIDNGNHPLYTLEFMDLSKQYSTCGVCGFNETIELLGENILEEKGVELGIKILDKINDTNDQLQTLYKNPHNCEQIPAEGTAVKLADKDRLLGYQDSYVLYSNQFIPLTTNASLLDRIRLQGVFDAHFSGGAICHLNVEQQVENWEDIADLIRMSAKKGVIYFAINYTLAECEHGHMSVTKGDKCNICGGNIINHYMRVVGFITNVKNWIKTRREVDYPNRQFYNDIKEK